MDKVFSCMGATNHSDKTRQENDFYSTPEIATLELLRRVSFVGNILEPACGTGAISKILKRHLSNKITSQDIVDRGYGDVKDFLLEDKKYDNIVTNPPFNIAKEFIEKAIELSNDKVVMLSKIQLLESKKRYSLFKKYPPKYIYVFVNRLPYLRGDVEQKEKSAMCLCWYVWEKGFNGNPTIDWIE